jgi:zinc transporter ZupT
MEPGAFLAVGGGFLAANLLLATLSSWGRAIAEVRRTYASVHPWRMVVLTSLFNAGPWLLVVVALFVYYEHSAPWAVWFFGGAAVWLVYVGSLMGVVYARRRGKGNKNAV